MNPSQLLWLDRYVGIPACALLTCLEFLRRRFGRRDPGPPRRIVFVKLIEMGSTVLACPAFAEAEQLVGRDNMFLLVFSENSAIAQVLPFFREENVITIDNSRAWALIAGLWRAVRRIRRAGVDTAVDMEGLVRSSAIVAWLTGARRRVGYYNFTSEGPYRGRLFTHELNYGFQQHTSVAFAALVRALRAPTGQVPMLKERIASEAFKVPRVQSTAEERELVRAMIQAEQEGGPIVLLNPNCSDLIPLRRWEPEKFVELGRKILEEEADARVVVIGGPGEETGAEEIARGIGETDRVVSLAGRTSLRQLLTLFAVADVLVSSDSGPCHFAALTSVGIVALFGPETPMLYRPLSPRVKVVSADLACSPCVNMLNHRFSPCQDNKCMQAITVAEVYEAVHELCSSRR